MDKSHQFLAIIIIYISISIKLMVSPYKVIFLSFLCRSRIEYYLDSFKIRNQELDNLSFR